MDQCDLAYDWLAVGHGRFRVVGIGGIGGATETLRRIDAATLAHPSDWVRTEGTGQLRRESSFGGLVLGAKRTQ